MKQKFHRQYLYSLELSLFSEQYLYLKSHSSCHDLFSVNWNMLHYRLNQTVEYTPWSNWSILCWLWPHQVMEILAPEVTRWQPMDKENNKHITKISVAIHKATNRATLLKNQLSIKRTSQLVKRCSLVSIYACTH